MKSLLFARSALGALFAASLLFASVPTARADVVIEDGDVDTTPPTFDALAVDFEPGSPHSTADGRVIINFSLHATDDLSGVELASVQCPSDDGGRTLSALLDLAQGTRLDGTWTGRADIQQYEHGGTYTTCSVNGYDRAGNHAPQQALPINPIVIGDAGVDTTPPTFDGLTADFEPGSPHSTADGPIIIDFSLHATDDLSGVELASVQCPSDDGGRTLSALLDLAQGTRLDGTWTGRADIQQYEHGGTYTTCSVNGYDRAGNHAPQQALPINPIVVDEGSDTVPPVVTGAADRGPDVAGWYNHPVTITWTATDPAPSSGGPTQPAPTMVTQDGPAQGIRSAESCDVAGNCARGVYGPLNYDATPPTVLFNQAGPSVAKGSTLTGMVSDPASSVWTYTITVETSPGNSNGAGNSTKRTTTTVKCNGISNCVWSLPLSNGKATHKVTISAVDVAGNAGAPVTRTFNAA